MANWYGAAATAMFFACGLCPASAGQPRLAASAVREMIRTEGADKAVRRLFEDRATEGALLNGIGTGGAGWLRVAQELRPVSDGAASEGLDIAIQDALPNPVGVLTLVRKGAFSATSACGNYGSDERPMPVILPLSWSKRANTRSRRWPFLRSQLNERPAWTRWLESG